METTTVYWGYMGPLNKTPKREQPFVSSCHDSGSGFEKWISAARPGSIQKAQHASSKKSKLRKKSSAESPRLGILQDFEEHRKQEMPQGTCFSDGLWHLLGTEVII